MRDDYIEKTVVVVFTNTDWVSLPGVMPVAWWYSRMAHASFS
jgi:hypothetical protein